MALLRDYPQETTDGRLLGQAQGLAHPNQQESDNTRPGALRSRHPPETKEPRTSRYERDAGAGETEQTEVETVQDPAYANIMPQVPGWEQGRRDIIAEVPFSQTQGLAEALQRLIDGRVRAVKVTEFCAPDECQSLVQRIHGLDPQGYDDEPALVYFGGDSFYNRRHSREALEDYFQRAVAWMRDLVDGSDAEWPSVRAMRLMDYILPGGARLNRDRHGRPAFSGLPRAIREPKPLEWHTDNLRADDKFGLFREYPELLLSIVVYLRMPGDGSGALQIRDLKPSIEQLAALRVENSPYELDADAMNELAPSVSVLPQTGDAIILDAECTHRVRRPNEERVTVSAFCGVHADGSGRFHS